MSVNLLIDFFTTLCYSAIQNLYREVVMKKVVKPTFSYVIPAYNAGPFLQGTLDSILGQGLKKDELEIIVGNDASTDDTQRVIDKFKKFGVRSFCNRQNKGCAVTRNIAHSMATKQFAGFLDADDLLVDGSVKKMQSFILENGADMVIPRLDKFFEGSNPNEVARLKKVSQQLGSSWPENLDTETLNNLKGEDFFIKAMDSGVRMWVPVIKRENLLKNNVKYRVEDTDFCEDEIYALENYIASTKPAVFDQPYYLYRRQPNTRASISQGMIDKRVQLVKYISEVMIPQNPQYAKFLGKKAQSFNQWIEDAKEFISE